MYAVSKLIIPGLVDQLNSMKNLILPNLLTEHPQVRQFILYTKVFQACHVLNYATSSIDIPYLHKHAHYQHKMFLFCSNSLFHLLLPVVLTHNDLCGQGIQLNMNSFALHNLHFRSVHLLSSLGQKTVFLSHSPLPPDSRDFAHANTHLYAHIVIT